MPHGMRNPAVRHLVCSENSTTKTPDNNRSWDVEALAHCVTSAYSLFITGYAPTGACPCVPEVACRQRNRATAVFPGDLLHCPHAEVKKKPFKT